MGLSDLETKIKIAHLEAQNAVALECIKQINEAMDELSPMNEDDTFAAISLALEWFKNYGI